MTRQDWLVGADRRTEAVHRIHSAAAELVSQKGFEALTIDALAARVHCSPATIYRHAGGKAAITEGVVQLMSARIVAHVAEAIAGLEGQERVVTALLVALKRIRAEPLGQLMMGAWPPDQENTWLTNSPLINQLAEHVLGHHDPAAAQWLLRATMALWFWPVKDHLIEREIAERFIGPLFVARSVGV